MSIHSRRAAKEVLDALAHHPEAGIPVLHWFSGTKAELERAKDMGCWFSIGPAMLKSKHGRELIRFMPRNRVITETDGPFTIDGEYPLEPVDVVKVIKHLSNIWDIELDVARSIIEKNFISLTKLGGAM
jgi:TatD DNase family protein